jgi:CARDB
VAARVHLLAVALFLASLVLTEAPAAAQGPIFATVEGPAAAGPGRPVAYNLSLSGGPSGNVTYNVTWHVAGPNLAGASPLEATPGRLSGMNTTFRLNVTAPSTEQTISLIVKVTAPSGATIEEAVVERFITIITPIVLTATFRNEGSTAAANVTVRFYVDDVLVGTSTIARINPNGQATATFDYLPAGLATGTHRVRIEADLDSNGKIDQANGEAVLTDLFYKGTPGLSPGWALLVGIGVFVPAFLVTVAVRRRQRT